MYSYLDIWKGAPVHTCQPYIDLWAYNSLLVCCLIFYVSPALFLAIEALFNGSYCFSQITRYPAGNIRGLNGFLVVRPNRCFSLC